MFTNLSSIQLLKNFTLLLLFALIKTPLIHAQQHTINSFVDSSLKDKEVLKEQLSNQTNHNSFHLFSHGLSGELFLNNQWLSHDALAAFIQPLLQDKTHLNIYGCHFAQGEKGRAALAYLETALGISVAASDDLTGVDGDWDLEVGNYKNGVTIQEYSHNLQQGTLPIQPGMAATTCGSFTSANQFHSDPTGYVFGIFDIREPGCAGTPGANAPNAPANWASAGGSNAYHDPRWTNENLGEVFGVDLEYDQASSPDIFLASGGLTNIGTGTNPTILPMVGGTGGEVFRIDGTTGDITVVATLPNHTFIYNPTFANSGEKYVGLGNLSYNAIQKKLYVTNLEDGNIYVVDATTTSTIDQVYDPTPGSADNTNLHYTQRERMVYGIEYNKCNGRVYYSRPNGNGSDADIFSVGLNGDGTIDNVAPVLHHSFATSVPEPGDGTEGAVVSDIEFSDDCTQMLTSERELRYYDTALSLWAHHAGVQMHDVSGATWTTGVTYDIGTVQFGAWPHVYARNAGGGVSFGYSNYGSCDAATACSDAMVATGDALVFDNDAGTFIYGLQISDLAGTSSYPNNSYFIDLDGNTGNNENYDKFTNYDVDVFGGSECSVAPCSIDADGLASVSCTGTNAITFSLTPTGTSTSAGGNYNVSVSGGTISPTSGNYGAATTFTLNDNSAGGGNVTVTISDGTESSCTRNVTVTDPGTCLAPCSLSMSQTSTCSESGGVYTQTYDLTLNWTGPPATGDLTITLTGNGTLNTSSVSAATLAGGSTTTLAGAFTVPADGDGTTTITATFDDESACTSTFTLKAPVPCPADVNPCASTAGCIGGKVFEDFNCNGVDDTEPGVQGVQIQVYDCNNNLVGTGYSDSEGDWQVCGLTDGTAYRIEHVLPEAVACWATPTHVGTDNGSDIQFLTAPACTQFSVSSPSDYCEVNPKLLTTCFVNGDPNDATVTGQDVLVEFNYDGTGKAVVDVAGNVGSTWGVAFDQQNQRYFVSTVLRRHSGIADNLGTIYVADPISGTPTVFTTLSNVGTIASNTDRGLTTSTAPSQDQEAFSKIGKVGIGDIDLSEDGSTLYAVNLNTRKVVAINTTSLAETELPAFPEPGCSSGVARPWALKVYRGAIYLGVVCSGENGGSQSDLSAHIMKYENGSWSTKLSFALDYNKACSYDYFGTTTGCGGWSPWFDDDTTDPPADYIFGYEFFSYPTPIFSDLEFTEDGSILMAFLDRSSMQYGAQNHPPYNNTNSDYEYVSGGDILVAHNVNGNLIFENNGASGEPTTTGQSNGQGPNGGEFIYEDEYLSDDAHYEVSTGGIAVLKGTNEFALSRIDPSALNSGGIGWFGSTTGQSTNTLELYAGGIANGFMSKSAGIGDVELLCAPAPLEIGNYVWCDSLNNGIQDACERGISGINVSLYDRTGALVGVTTTSATGQYYFNENNVDTTGVDATGVANNAYTGMSYATQYFIVFGAGGQFSTDEFTVGGDMYGITAMANTGSNDNIDSDVDGSNLSTALLDMPAGLPFIDMTTSATGCGDHKYDLGVTCTVPTYSLGNQVFTDTDNSGDLNGGETGIDDVVLQLLNSDGSVYDGDTGNAGIQALTVTTASSGYYRFDDLPAGDYIIEVVASNFAATSILENLVSSTGAAQEAGPNSDMDINDNGLDSQVSGATRSGVVTLGTPEPTGEAEPGTYGGGSTTGTAAADTESNLTVDFGFYGICNLTITENTQSVCNDNGTSSNASDDYFTIDFNATAVNGGTQYQVVQGANADGTGGTVLATSNYGTAVTVGTATTFDADGTTTYAITVRDATTNTCHQEVTTTSVASCSATCVLTITENTQSSCNDNGTSSNASDDYFTIDFNATAINGGTQYQVVQGANADGTGGTVLATSNYGTAVTVGTATTFDADGTTTYAITVRDATTNTCHQEVTTTSVASCSATCVLTITENTQSSCNDNGTSSNASDDYFTIDFNATAINGGTQYQVVQGANADGTGGTVLATSNYGTAVTVGTATTFDADGTTTYAITVRDATTNTCHQEVTTTSVASCSACPTSICLPIQVTIQGGAKN